MLYIIYVVLYRIFYSVTAIDMFKHMEVMRINRDSRINVGDKVAWLMEDFVDCKGFKDVYLRFYFGLLMKACSFLFYIFCIMCLRSILEIF